MEFEKNNLHRLEIHERNLFLFSKDNLEESYAITLDDLLDKMNFTLKKNEKLEVPKKVDVRKKEGEK